MRASERVKGLYGWGSMVVDKLLVSFGDWSCRDISDAASERRLTLSVGVH